MKKALLGFTLMFLISATLLFSAIQVQPAKTSDAVATVSCGDYQSSVTTGDTFKVDVVFEGLDSKFNAAGFDFNLSWDPLILQVESMQEVEFHNVTPQAEWGNIWVVVNEVASSSVRYECTWYDDAKAVNDGYGPISGNGTLATIVFRAGHIGQTTLHFNRAICGDVECYPVPLAAIDGNVTVTAGKGTDMYLSINAPASMNHGNTMDYNFYYYDLPSDEAQNVVLTVTLSSTVEFVSASPAYTTYDPSSGVITWTIGTVPGFSWGSATATVTILDSVATGTVITTTAYVNTTTPETSYVDNSASAQTTVTGVNLPQNVDVGPYTGTAGDGTPLVYWQTPTTFTYTDTTRTANNVLISIQMDDLSWVTSPAGDAMTQGSSSIWTYSTTFYPFHGKANVTYTVDYASGSPLILNFSMYVDPAGYVYDANTFERIAGATVWLQGSYGSVEWQNVPTGLTPPLMQPDLNPQTTGVNGQFQWDVPTGIYRLYVEAAGYYSANSIAVSVPPPVTDIHIGLVKVIAGDINRDSIVNILDAILLSNAYLGTPGKANWNANADINGDNIVNILDAIILSNHYLQHYP